jgi:hypothetical protein
VCALAEHHLVFVNVIIVADEISWPACSFILKHLMEHIIEIEKEEDPFIRTSKASPHMEAFTGNNDDFRFHHYFDLVCGAGIGGYVLAISHMLT